METTKNITPTPWNPPISTYSVGKGTVTFECTPEEIDRAKTAVNCTYGANINPEKIQELIAAYTELVQSVPFERFPYGLKHRAEQALNNIKYKK